MEIRTRFAPSPTGYMHIGNLRTAIYEYLVAKSQNGKFILRIEDTDQKRFVEGAIEVIYSTLKAVGLGYDEGPDIGGRYGPYVQSERKDIYKEYGERLVELGGAYYCFCSDESNENAEKSFGYNKKCREMTDVDRNKKLIAKEKYVIRQKIPSSCRITFNDYVYGEITVDSSTLDDGVLIKSDGLPTYNFANVIDDHLMNITHVVRGAEYLSSTPKYNLIYNSFGWTIPEYVHLPPIMRDATKKLSKRDGDASFSDYINKGYLVDALVNYIVLLGWNPGNNEEIFTLGELKEKFSLAGLSKSPAIFDPIKLKWMNGEYIRKMNLVEFHEIARHYYKNKEGNELNFKLLSKVLQPRVEILSDINEMIDFLYDLPEYSIDLFENKKAKCDSYQAKMFISQIAGVLEKSEKWESESIFADLDAFSSKSGIKKNIVLWILRIALSGKEITPGSSTEIAEIIGKNESMRRLNIAKIKLGIA